MNLDPKMSQITSEQFRDNVLDGLRGSVKTSHLFTSEYLGRVLSVYIVTEVSRSEDACPDSSYRVYYNGRVCKNLSLSYALEQVMGGCEP